MKKINKLLGCLWALAVLLFITKQSLAQSCCPNPCMINGVNLITNGDFEAGNTGFSSQYIFEGPGAGHYYVRDSSYLILGNRKGNPGKFFFADAKAGLYAWKQPVPVSPGKKYTFCFDHVDLHTTLGDPPRLVLSINNDTLFNDTIPTGPVWRTKSLEWIANSDTAYITFSDSDPDTAQNDFGLDNIKLVETQKPNAGPDISLCQGDVFSLPAPLVSNWQYLLLTGDTTVGSLVGNKVKPSFSSTYILKVSKDTLCTLYDTVTVNVAQCCKYCSNSCLPPFPNQIINGDFEAGNTGFESQYSFQDSGVGRYFVQYNSKDTLGNRKGNPGKFFFADGKSGLYAWKQSPPVKPGKKYILCFEYVNLHSTQSIEQNPILVVVINGDTVFIDTIPSGPTWYFKSIEWIASSDIADIRFSDPNPDQMGLNDFGLDNITFRECYSPSAGPDLSICKGDSVILPTDSLYPWNYQVLSGDSASLMGNRAKPAKTTRYLYRVMNPADSNCIFYDTVTVTVKKCCQCDSCSIPGADLIINGDFEAGATGFASQYAFEDSTTGSYFVRDSSAEVGLGNRLGNGGNFLFADGSTVLNQYVWRQPVAVSPKKKYVLCFDYVNLNTHDNLPVLNVRINGASVITVIVPSGPGWHSATATWMSGSATLANIEFYDNNTDAGGNDFGIDNISFRECTPKVKADAGPDKTICLGTSTTLGIPPAPLQWSYQVLSSPAYYINTNVVSPTRRTTYVLTVTDSATGCKAYDTVVVDVVCCPCDTIVLYNSINLISNGDFSSGNTGFSSAYTYGGSLSGGPGTYWINSSANTYNSNWDKTGNPGNFLIADGAGNSSMYVWSQTLSVTPGKTYNLCAEAINLNQAPGYPAMNDPTLAILINGIQVASISLDEWHSWTPVHASWNAGANSSATIDIVSLNSSSSGNDFGIDNIRFSPCDEPALPGNQEPGSSSNNKAQVLRPELNIYPNPAANSIQVLLPASTLSPEKIIITDINGRTVKSIPVPKNNNKELKISLSGLSQGLYTIAVYSRDECLGKKLFMKE